VVGEGDGRTAVFGGTPAEAIHAACAVEQRVFTVNVEMDERTHRTAFS
jgi:hypothetical protein